MKRLALLFLVAACGGGSTPADGVSKADYLAKAEAICAQANKDQDALKTPTAVDALAPYVARIVEIADTATTAISALEAPTADAADLRLKVLDPLTAQLVTGHAYADQVAEAAKKNDTSALVKLLSSPPNQTKADLRWMEGYGFKECVEAADTSG